MFPIMHCPLVFSFYSRGTFLNTSKFGSSYVKRKKERKKVNKKLVYVLRHNFCNTL